MNFRGNRTERGEEGKGEGGERGEEEILADGRTDQSKVVQEVLADLKTYTAYNAYDEVALHSQQLAILDEISQ